MGVRARAPRRSASVESSAWPASRARVLVAAALSGFALQFASDYWQFVALLCGTAMGSSFIWAPLLVMVVRSTPSMKGMALI